MCPEEKGHLFIQERGHYNHSAPILTCSAISVFQFGVDSFFNKHFRSKLLRHILKLNFLKTTCHIFFTKSIFFKKTQKLTIKVLEKKN